MDYAVLVSKFVLQAASSVSVYYNVWKIPMEMTLVPIYVMGMIHWQRHRLCLEPKLLGNDLWQVDVDDFFRFRIGEERSDGESDENEGSD